MNVGWDGALAPELLPDPHPVSAAAVSTPQKASAAARGLRRISRSSYHHIVDR